MSARPNEGWNWCKQQQRQKSHSHFTLEWFFPISVKLLMIGNRPMFVSRDFFDSFSCWCRCRRSKASFTFSLTSLASKPLFVIFSVTRSATVSRLLASMSSMTVPVNSRFRSSNKEWSDNVATCGLLQRSPPSSTSSSNFTQRAVSFHSISSPSRTNSSISENSGCDSWGGWWLPSPPFTSSPRMNWTRWAGGVTVLNEEILWFNAIQLNFKLFANSPGRSCESWELFSSGSPRCFRRRCERLLGTWTPT